MANKVVISDAVNTNSSVTAASSTAVKTAYDKAVEAANSGGIKVLNNYKLSSATTSFSLTLPTDYQYLKIIIPYFETSAGISSVIGKWGNGSGAEKGSYTGIIYNIDSTKNKEWAFVRMTSNIYIAAGQEGSHTTNGSLVVEVVKNGNKWYTTYHGYRHDQNETGYTESSPAENFGSGIVSTLSPLVFSCSQSFSTNTTIMVLGVK